MTNYLQLLISKWDPGFLDQCCQRMYFETDFYTRPSYKNVVSVIPFRIQVLCYTEMSFHVNSFISKVLLIFYITGFREMPIKPRMTKTL